MAKKSGIQAWWDAAKPPARGVAVALAKATDETIAAATPTSIVRREYAKLPGTLQSVLAVLPQQFYASPWPEVKIRITYERNNHHETKDIVCRVGDVGDQVRGTITALTRTGVVGFDIYVDAAMKLSAETGEHEV